MKVCVIQPPYYTDYSRSEECFRLELEMLDRCDPSMDLIVLPESSDMPSLNHNQAERLLSIQKYNAAILEKAAETARRCDAVVFVNARSQTEQGAYINTTYAINRQGEVVGMYKKEHPTAGEVAMPEGDCSYSFQHSVPYTVEIDGLRYAFLTCYDFYFYEAFSNIARQRPDIIIGCSHQRSDTHLALEIIGQFLCYNTNAYLVRASVSMDENSDIGGGSMVVAPTGEILLNMKSRVGMECAEFDPHHKYYKPAGYGNPPAAHFEYIEKGRRPWKYRPGGSAMVCPDHWMPYPRVCAHRGFNTIAPENSLPAYGAAVAMGAEEIEFDLWFTKDGQVVSLHDPTLDRVSNGTGNVWEYTYEELLQFDFGCKHAPEFAGIKIPTFEDILKKFACHTVMNIHLKTAGEKPEYLQKVMDLVHKYDCQQYVYFMTGDDELLERLQREYPEMLRCCGGGSRDKRWHIVERAIKYGCQKLQFFKGYFDEAMVKKAKAHGIITNVFWSDDPEETRRFLDMGIDVILTNDYNRISQVVAAYKKQ